MQPYWFCFIPEDDNVGAFPAGDHEERDPKREDSYFATTLQLAEVGNLSTPVFRVSARTERAQPSWEGQARAFEAHGWVLSMGCRRENSVITASLLFPVATGMFCGNS